MRYKLRFLLILLIELTSENRKSLIYKIIARTIESDRITDNAPLSGAGSIKASSPPGATSPVASAETATPLTMLSIEPATLLQLEVKQIDVFAITLAYPSTGVS